jgi:hypothetical protein
MSFKKKIISKDITKIFDNNEIEDLKIFMKKRHCLNNFNLFLVYLFHFIQSAGILVTTIATGYNKKYLIWVGIGLNILASLINIYEKINNKVLKKLMLDIQKIKDGNYIDESSLIDMDNNEGQHKNTKHNNEQNNNEQNNNEQHNNEQHNNKIQAPLFIDNQNNQNKVIEI